MAARVHVHGAVEGEGRERAAYYKDELRRLYETGVLCEDLCALKLSLDDEDVRYTTEPRPGICGKIACVDALQKGWPERVGGDIVVWDLYAAPGMDVLYSMMIPLWCKGQQVHVVGVSIVHDDKERARFRRMQANVAALEKMSDNVGTCALVQSSAQDFCRDHGQSAEPCADVLLLSPPWLTSHGEMKDRHEKGKLRSCADIAAEVKECLDALSDAGRPRVLSFMVPQDWQSYEKFDAFRDYVCVETIRVEKQYGSNMHMADIVSSLSLAQAKAGLVAAARQGLIDGTELNESWFQNLRRDVLRSAYQKKSGYYLHVLVRARCAWGNRQETVLRYCA